MEYVLLAAGSILCAILAIRATRLLTAALWLAAVSMFTALILYLLGAREVAVIELSVGAGLVTVLMVFAISIAGDDAMQARSLISRPIAWLLIVFALLLLGFLILPVAENTASVTETSSFQVIFWKDRTLDVVAQIALIFAGVLGVLGILSRQEAVPILPHETSLESLESEAESDDKNLHVIPQPIPEEEPV